MISSQRFPRANARPCARSERRRWRPGFTIKRVAGRDITEADWDQFFAFYMDTGSRKWGRPYLNREFFSRLGQAMPDQCLLFFVERAGRTIAGALNMIGGDCLYGRYWGCIEQHSCLHFEVCYYQAIDFAIEHRLARVEAGAQGDHKLARGYLPVPTYSLHWIADAGLRKAVRPVPEGRARTHDGTTRDAGGIRTLPQNRRTRGRVSAVFSRVRRDGGARRRRRSGNISGVSTPVFVL